MKKKLLATLLATAFAVTTLVGCGGSNAAAPAASSSDNKTAETTEAADVTADAAATTGKQTDGKNVPVLTTEPMEITLWDISTEDPNKSIAEAAVARFEADYPNIKVNHIHQQNDTYKQQLVVAMSSGQ